MKIHKFKESLNIGKIGEEIVKSYLVRKGYRVVKLSIEEEIKFGYDFKVFKNKRVIGIEVKTDIASKFTNNIFIETEVNCKLGWYRKYTENSKIFIVFVLLHSNELIFVRISKLIKNLKLENYKSKKVFNTFYTAKGYVIPIDEIKKLGIIKKI